MKNLRAVARPYAKAAYNFAKENKALAHWSFMLNKTSELIKYPEIFGIISKLSTNNLYLLLSDALSCHFKQEEIVFTEEMKNFLLLIISNNRIISIKYIYDFFIEYEMLDTQSLNVDVISAVSLSVDQHNKLLDKLSRRFKGKNMVVRSIVDSNLLGGLIIRVGDIVIDGSLHGQLTKLSEFVIG